jgi:hypothetical protein
VLILGTLAATLIQTMHLFPLQNPPLTLNIIQFLKLLFVPMIVLVISWLSSYMIQTKGVRIVLKSFSWIYALLLLLIDLAFFLGIIFAFNILGTPMVVALLWVPSLVYLASIRKRYKLIYPDSKFLNRIQILFCILITVVTTLEMVFTAPLI